MLTTKTPQFSLIHKWEKLNRDEVNLHLNAAAELQHALLYLPIQYDSSPVTFLLWCLLQQQCVTAAPNYSRDACCDSEEQLCQIVCTIQSTVAKWVKSPKVPLQCQQKASIPFTKKRFSSCSTHKESEACLVALGVLLQSSSPQQRGKLWNCVCVPDCKRCFEGIW